MSTVAAQSRRMSLTETLTNTAIGYAINQTAQIIVFPLAGIHIPLSANLALGAFFTVISVSRGYLLRRLFEWRQRRIARKSPW